MYRWPVSLLLTLAACSERPLGESTTDASTTGGDPQDSTSMVSTGDAEPTTQSSDPGTTSTSTTTGGSGESTFGEGECPEAPFIDLNFERPQVMLVIDKSSSMVSKPWDHDEDDADDDGLQDADDASPATPRRTRWQSTIDVLTEFLSAREGALHIGAALFPSMEATQMYDEGACITNAMVEAPVGSSATQILMTLPPAEASNLKGASPARRGIEAAVTELQGIPFPAIQRMIVLTDGAGNCAAEAPDAETLFESSDPLLEQVVAGAHAQGISTHVIGLEIADVTSDQTKDGYPDDTNAYERLNTLAVAGGVARDGADKFYNVKTDTEMAAALAEIADGLIPCTLFLNFELPLFEFLELTVNDVPYGKASGVECTELDGWRWVDETHLGIELCGQACLDFRASGDIDARVRCPND